MFAVGGAVIALVAAMAPNEKASTWAAEATAEQPGAVFRDCTDVCPEMVVLPAGAFDRGAPPYTPPGRVVIERAFAIGRYHVTVGEYGAFIRERGRPDVGNCHTRRGTVGEHYLDPDGSWRDPGFEQSDRHPVVCVNHPDARAYVAWLSEKTGQTYRLLTEQEWEFAARAGRTNDFIDFGGKPEEFCKYANVADARFYKVYPSVRPETCDDGYLYTSPAGSFPPNKFGLYDMVGNAAQWTSTRSQVHDRIFYMVRGGSWFERAGDASFFVRPNDESWHRRDHVGFRVVREVEATLVGARDHSAPQ